MADLNQQSLTKFLRYCVEESGIGQQDNMVVEMLGDGAFIAIAPDKTRFLITAQQLPPAAEAPVRVLDEPVINESKTQAVGGDGAAA